MSNTSLTSSQDHSLQLLLEALKINAEANHANARNFAHLAVNAPDLSSSSSASQDQGSQLVEAFKINAEATRVSAQALAHLVCHRSKPSETAPDAQPQLSPQPRSTAKPAKFVINERVGKITTAEWDALGNEKIASLVVVLHGIVDDIASGSQSWVNIGNTISSRLVAFGFTFLKQGEQNPNGDWGQVQPKEKDKKTTVAVILECSRGHVGEKWYTYDMLRVLSRLMELTDA